MPSCWTRRHAFLLSGRVCLLVEREDTSSCSTRRRVFVFNKKQEDMSSCWARRHVFLLNKKTCLLVPQDDMPPSTRRHVFLFKKKTSLFVQHGEMSFPFNLKTCPLFSKKTCLPVDKGDLSRSGSRSRPEQWPSRTFSVPILAPENPKKNLKKKAKSVNFEGTLGVATFVICMCTYYSHMSHHDFASIMESVSLQMWGQLERPLFQRGVKSYIYFSKPAAYYWWCCVFSTSCFWRLFIIEPCMYKLWLKKSVQSCIIVMAL